MNTKKTNLSTKRLRSIALVLMIGAFFSLVLEGFLSLAHLTKAQTTVQEKTVELYSAPSSPEALMTTLSLEARAAFVVDVANNNVVFAKNEDQKLPLASLTKLMTALVAREYVSDTANVTISSHDLTTEGDSGLREGERFRVADLLDIMLLVSSNDAAHAVARFVGSKTQNAKNGAVHGDVEFVRMMNERARTLGFTHTEFFNETGLDVSPVQNGGYGSSREVAALFIKIYKNFPATLEITTRKHSRITSRDGVVHVFPNTNEAISYLPGLIASKTGYTDLAGGNLAIMFDGGIGRPFVAVVLGSTYKGRFEDMRKLMQAVRATL